MAVLMNMDPTKFVMGALIEILSKYQKDAS